MADNHTTIRVTNETKTRLKKHGKKDESYDELVSRILDDFEEVADNEN